jgi:hypothetical protein
MVLQTTFYQQTPYLEGSYCFFSISSKNKEKCQPSDTFGMECEKNAIERGFSIKERIKKSFLRVFSARPPPIFKTGWRPGKMGTSQ